jgi:hypothetical protein
VFDRGADFDPRQDTIVRVQGRRLRDRLADYYRGQGVDRSVVISLPKGHYVPTYQWRHVRPRCPPIKATAANCFRHHRYARTGHWRMGLEQSSARATGGRGHAAECFDRRAAVSST